MIITKTPMRMSFFGGGTDFPSFYNEHGGAVISSTFDKYCYITVRHLPPFFDYKNELVYAKTERVCELDSICHPAIREGMKWFDMRDIRLSYDADLPARTGLGTSSSFAVGMLNAFHCLKGEYANKRRLADEAIYLERTLCAESGGIQDQIAAAFGGFNRIDFSANGYTVNPIIIKIERKKQLNRNLLLFFTGFSRFSSNIQIAHEKAIQGKTQELKELLALVDEAENILTGNGDLNEFGRLLDYSWKLKRGITARISTDSIDALYERAMRAGATGGKLLGAGGGGFLLFYVEQENQPGVRRALDAMMEVPFSFENDGANVLYYSPEVYERKRSIHERLDTQNHS